MIGISVGTPKPAYRVVGTIGNGAITKTWVNPAYVTSVYISTFFDPLVSEIPLVCYIKLTFDTESDYEEDYCG